VINVYDFQNLNDMHAAISNWPVVLKLASRGVNQIEQESGVRYYCRRKFFLYGARITILIKKSLKDSENNLIVNLSLNTSLTVTKVLKIYDIQIQIYNFWTLIINRCSKHIKFELLKS